MHSLSSFQRLALWTTAITYFLILVGGLVRASGAGLGCPDWPRCFGGWIPPMSAADLPAQFDASQFNATLMWTEYLNRMLGMAVGVLILATAVSAWRHHRGEPRILWTSIAALLLTGFQGWLGGRVVAHELAAWIVTIHMMVALVIVQMLLYVTVVSQDKPEGLSSHTIGGDKPLGLSISLLIVITLVQIGLGTQVRGGVDAALDGGTARADALATVGWLDYAHRDAAIVVLLAAILLTLWLFTRSPEAGGRSPQLRWSYSVLALAALQVTIGMLMAYGSLTPAAQVLHLTIASLLLGAETVLLLLSWSQTA